MTNYVFAYYSLNIAVEILKIARLCNELFIQYTGVARFKADIHNVFIQARADNKSTWLKWPYMVSQEDILTVVEQWPDKWMKYEGSKIDIPVPPVKEVGEGPSQPPPGQQSDPPVESEGHEESQQSTSDQGGDGGVEEQQQQ